MRTLVAISRVLDWPARVVGYWLRWLVAALVALQFANVALRYLFASSEIKLQESVIYTHGILFMTMVGYAYLRDDHVRVDMTYDPAGPRTRAVIDLAGIVFGVLPLCVMLGWFGWPYVRASWAMGEGAMFFGGIPAAYLLKTVILLFVGFLAIQALAIALRCIAVLGGADVAVFERKKGDAA